MMHLFLTCSCFIVPRENLTTGGLFALNTVTECMAKDSQPSLDLASATSGDKIVTAQVSELFYYYALWLSGVAFMYPGPIVLDTACVCTQTKRKDSPCLQMK